jgi:predicted ABC-type ATPase
MVPKWQAAGHQVELIYLKLRSSKLAEARVRDPVRQGGHSIEPDVIRRRFEAGWKNFETPYVPLVNHWELHDNSGQGPILVAKGDRV